MNAFDLIKRKAKKLKALADRGIGGEKSNAKAFLDEFMKKHSLTEDDVDDNAFIRFFKHRGLDYNTIVTNSIISVNPFLRIEQEENAYKVSLDDYDFLEAEYKANFFYELFLKEMDSLFHVFKRNSNSFRQKSDEQEKELFFTAFMTKHQHCFQPDNEAVLKHRPKTKPVSKKEAEAMRKAQEESDKAFREMQAKVAKENKKQDKSEHPPTPINYGDIDRIYAIIELMRDANYVKVRNVLPVFIRKIKSNAKSKSEKK